MLPVLTKARPQLFTIGPPSGKYLYPCIGDLGSNTLVVTANRLYAEPFAIGAPFLVDRIGYEVTSGTAGNCRMGIYAHDPAAFGPGALLLDGGTGDTASTAVVEITVDQVLSPGLWWLAAVFSATPTIRRLNAGIGGQDAILGHSTNNDTGSGSNYTGLYGSHTYGALPAAFPAITYAVAANSPLLHLRRA